MDGAGESVQKSDDTALAIAILVVTVVTAAIVAFNIWNNKKKQKKNALKEKTALQEPDGKVEYLQAKAKADLSDPAQRDTLKKLLMRRAIRTIPLIMQLQNEGSSVERLYKKGMLTDDVHSKAKELRSFVEREVPECQAEANELADGWGEVFWNQAAQVANTIRQQTESAEAGSSAAQPSSPKPAPAAAPATAVETEEQKKKKAEAAKLKEKEKKRAEKLAAMRSIGTTQADPGLVGDDSADDVARQLIEEEEKERSKQGPKKGKK